MKTKLIYFPSARTAKELNDLFSDARDFLCRAVADGDATATGEGFTLNVKKGTLTQRHGKTSADYMGDEDKAKEAIAIVNPLLKAQDATGVKFASIAQRMMEAEKEIESLRAALASMTAERDAALVAPAPAAPVAPRSRAAKGKPALAK